MQEYFRVGVITSPHGVRGEVKVFPTTDDASRFKKLKEVLVEQRGIRKEMKVQHVKFFKNMVILKLEGIESMNDAEFYRKCDLMVDRKNAIPLEEGEYYIGDLIGMNVITDEGRKLGILTDVMQTGANDVYVVNSPEFGEVLIPVIDDCVLDISLEKNEVLVHLLQGLIDEE
ncbi:MAG TPA: 16S rRNA processing protein RimM [Lachnospiraceae bacterium]|nr:16S rRNA processing protein RimM [Lachnospiraceae bacterium]